jgi:hypothetical protein
LLVRSYRTFAPLPFPKERRYISVALSSRSLALGVTQQVWFLRSPDFPQNRYKSACSHLAYSLFLKF